MATGSGTFHSATGGTFETVMGGTIKTLPSVSLRSEIFTIIPTKIKANKDMQDTVIDKIRKKDSPCKIRRSILRVFIPEMREWLYLHHLQ